MKQLLIRLIIESDLPHLLWSEEEKEFEDFHRENFEKAQQGEIVFLVAELDSAVVGRVRILPHTEYGVGWIFGLQVKPSLRNNGIGTQLMKKAEEILLQHHQSLVYLSVEVENSDALRLYKRLGYTIFHQAAQTWSYPKNGKRVALTQELYYLEKHLHLS